MGDRLERVLGGHAVRRVSSKDALLAPTMSTCAAVFGLAACSDGEIEWLGSAPGPLSPPCIVVAHLSVDCVKRLYPLRSDALRVLWADEVEDRLVEVLDEFGRVSRGSDVASRPKAAVRPFPQTLRQGDHQPGLRPAPGNRRHSIRPGNLRRSAGKPR